MYTYAWYHWLTFFYIYCFFGWIFESVYVSVKTRHFVNRGFLRLPMLPLYGTGAVMMLWVSLPVKNNLFLVYVSGFFAATLLEYVTGYVMERLFKVRYWDYSNQKFNLNGYICLTSSMAWGFLTIFMTEIIHRPIERFVLALPQALEWGLLAVISGCFILDTIRSTKEALDLAKALERVSKLRSELEELQVQLALLKDETLQNMENAKEEFCEAVTARKEALGEAVSARKEALGEAVSARKEAFGEAVSARKEAFGEAVSARKEAFGETVSVRKEALGEAVSVRKEALGEAVSVRREKLTEAITSRRELLAAVAHTGMKSASLPPILRRNPGAVSKRFASAWKELYGMAEKHKHS